MDDVPAIKRMITKYGSVVIAFYQNRSKYLNEETGAYYCPDTIYSNHLVNVIGWDDNYPAYNFLTRPEVDGAWLVKNSFGTDWGNDGYFWLSYADVSLSEDGFVFDLAPVQPRMKTYQYDGSVSYNYINDPNSKTVTAANVFTAIDNEKLVSVGFMTPSSYFSYKIEVYRGVRGLPDSGILYSTQSGEKLYSGFYTIPLEEPVDLVSGDRFSVIVEITAKENGQAYLMTDRSASYTLTDANDNKVVYQEFISNSHPDESFYRLGNSNWVDCWNEDPNQSMGNVRIKAFTQFMSYSSIKSADIASKTSGFPFLYRIDRNDRPVPVPNFQGNDN